MCGCGCHKFSQLIKVNYRNILLEVKDVISSLDRFASCLYIWKLLRQMQSNTRSTLLLTLEGI